MAITTLELLKKHVRADDFDADDELLDSYRESAEEMVLHEIGMSEGELEQSYGKIPAPLRQAVLLLAGFWYDHREAASVGQVSELPFAVRSLTLPYKRLLTDRRNHDSRTDETQAAPDEAGDEHR